jgi:bacteriocin biosynthesis cyclodehydratase domain-containing protein
MTDVFDELADTRPRIRRDVLFTQATNGVLFHAPGSGFRVTAKSAYKIAELLVPYLDGSHRLGDLCGNLPQGHRQMVGTMVKSLIDCGFARDVPAGDADLVRALLTDAEATEFSAQLAYIDHFQNGAAGRFRQLRDARIAVVGDDLVARWCALALIRNGCAHVDAPPGISAPGNAFADVTAEAEAISARGSDSAIRLTPELDSDVPDLSGYQIAVFTGPRAPHRVLRLLRAGIPQGCTILPVTTLGSRAVVGPSTTASLRPCWACAALRMTANSGGPSGTDLWARVCLPETGALDRMPGRQVAAMLGNLAGYEVFRLLTEAPPAETRGQLIVQDMDSLDAFAEPVHPHPRCPFCRAQGATEAMSLAGLRLDAPAVTALDAENQAGHLLAELAVESELVGSVAGVFRAFDDEWVTQTPLKISRVTLSVAGGQSRTVAAFDTHNVAAARRRALRVAAAVYVADMVPPNGVLTGAELVTAQRAVPAIDPASLVTASGTGGPASEMTGWVIATSLLDGQQALVPAFAISLVGAPDANGVFLPTGAGTGVGGSAGEAAYAGLFSALSHEALLAATRGRRPVRRIRLDALHDDPELRFLLSSAKNLDFEAELLDLTEPDSAAPKTLLARANDPVTGVPRWAVGCDAGWQRAAVDALRDLVGAVQLAQDASVTGPLDLGLPLVSEFDPWSLPVSCESVPELTATTSPTLVLRRIGAMGQRVLATYSGADDLRQRGLTVLRFVLTGRSS